MRRWDRRGYFPAIFRASSSPFTILPPGGTPSMRSTGYLRQGPIRRSHDERWHLPGFPSSHGDHDPPPIREDRGYRFREIFRCSRTGRIIPNNIGGGGGRTGYPALAVHSLFHWCQNTSASVARGTSPPAITVAAQASGPDFPHTHTYRRAREAPG